jgi:hypothetical protein
MILLYIILFFLFNFFIFLLGRSLSNYLKLHNNIVYIDLIYGVFLLGVILFTLNFFVGLDSLLVKLPIFFLILISLKNLNLNELKNYNLLLILSILIFPIIIYMGPGYDGGLYHLPHQNLIKNEKIIFGVGNLRRFGFGSINEYISAFLWIKENFILLKFLQGTYFLIFFCFIVESIKKLNINIKIILPIIFLLPLLQRYFTLAYTFTDISTTVFYVITFIHGYNFFLNTENKNVNLKKEITTFLILIFLTVSMKPTGSLIIFYAIGVFMYIIWNSNLSIKFFFYFSWIYFVFFLWYLKNLISTGCLIYPINLTCFKFLEWSSHQNSTMDYESAKSFARQPFAGDEPLFNWNWLTDYWINLYDKFLIGFFFANLLILFLFYLLNFFYKKNFFLLIKISTLTLFLIITIFFQESGLFIFGKYFTIIKTLIITNKYLFILIFVLILSLGIFLIIKNTNKIRLYLVYSIIFIFLSLILWFLNSPVPRFGLFLFFSISVLIIFLLSNLDDNIKISDLKIKNTLMICVLYYLVVVSSQATKVENLYTLKNISEIYWVDIIKRKNFDYPKKGISVKNEEIIPDIKLIKRSNYGYKPNTSDQCWLKLKCYAYNDVILYKKLLSYKFMKLAD